MLKIFCIAIVSSEQSHTIRTFLCCTDFDTMDTRLHVLEVQEVLAALRHHLQVGQQVQKLGEFVLDSEKRLGERENGRTVSVKLHVASDHIIVCRYYGGDQNGVSKVA